MRRPPLVPCDHRPKTVAKAAAMTIHNMPPHLIQTPADPAPRGEGLGQPLSLGILRFLAQRRIIGL